MGTILTFLTAVNGTGKIEEKTKRLLRKEPRLPRLATGRILSGVRVVQEAVPDVLQGGPDFA